VTNAATCYRVLLCIKLTGCPVKVCEIHLLSNTVSWLVVNIRMTAY